ncbi:MAG: prephenate dehydratase domain-containing protein, partial [Longicatena sp.]
TGEVGEVLDLLSQYKVYINEIYDLKISQNLLGIKGAKLEDIKQVYSKDQAIYQSKEFLNGRGYELIPYPNTALAAEYVAKCQDKTKAAIAASENASLYGLDILASDINTSNQNTTRFIVISDALIKQGNVFSLTFIVHHKAGSLVEAMNVIARYGFNMQSIKSRSIKKRPWEYYFYVEIAGDLNNSKEQQMVEELRAICEEVKIVGSYQKESRDE